MQSDAGSRLSKARVPKIFYACVLLAVAALVGCSWQVPLIISFAYVARISIAPTRLQLMRFSEASRRETTVHEYKQAGRCTVCADRLHRYIGR